MEIKKAEFEMSAPDLKGCPKFNGPEYAFIGRSNVGKSSLLNMLVQRKGLAKTSGRPGKTQLINFFKVNEQWFLVDLPGYGYAKVSKNIRGKFHQIITNYISKRNNLVNLFVLIDCRHRPQKIDLEFMEYLGVEGIPFSIVFTKIDKLSSSQLQRNLKAYKSEMLKQWEEMPMTFVSSAESGVGRGELLAYISNLNEMMKEKF